ncbi:uncharacterized protein LOC121994829 [Zingiber officinale]|uniref:uncharacterized protein LOC121994829 n=1 Tax=Zingiber officinale TaxID=94328 RepID=UPI001C4B0698|nr:uncharacterized protein LOC121994829 [Zingiber officinale]
MLEEALSEQKEMRSEIKQLTQRLENLEKHQKMQDSQIAQIAQSVSRAQGTFPGKPYLNLVEHYNRIELWSGRTVGNPQIMTQMGLNSEKELTPLMPNQTQNRDGEVKGDYETVALIENCSALLMVNPPPKLQDSGSFPIPCKIDSELIPRAFCDLGASVSLLLYSLCKKLGFQNIELTTMALQLADHSCRYPMGIVEDVPVEVGGCIVPTDFIILDMEEDPKIPIILGRPFIATAGVIIDVKSHKLSLEIGKGKIEFDLSNSSICNPLPREILTKLAHTKKGSTVPMRDPLQQAVRNTSILHERN